MKIDIKRKLLSRSDRVKCVDLHPTEPWVLGSLYNGSVYVWNYETQSLVKNFEVSDLPVRAAKFIARKNWIITGSDDMQIRIFNYNTHEKVASFDGHVDYIRSLAVHPTQPYVLSSSDDMTIKLWNWEMGWKCMQVFEGHAHYVMMVNFNPKDTNTFASASLDRTIKVWNIGSAVANFTLEGHEKGVNTVDYYGGNDKPYLVSGADDKLVKIWDYQNKSCVQTLEGHSQNVSAACFHPGLPVILTASEDGSVKVWHANTYRIENTLNYGLDRAWALAYQRGSNSIGIGYDEGAVVIKLGCEEPAISMDNSGKIIWAKHNEILTTNVKAGIEESISDGERMTLPAKDLGSCEVYPQALVHSPNGRFVVVCGDGEYIIYTALAWRNKSFGRALEFVWASESNEYAIRESSNSVKIFNKNFKEKSGLLSHVRFSVEGIFGGVLLGVCGSTFLNLYDWDTGSLIRRVDVVARNVYWSDAGDLMTIASDDSFFVLRFNRSAYDQFIESGGDPGDEGVEEALEFVTEIPESIKTGYWIGDCFVYTNSMNRLNYLVGEQVNTLAHFDTNMYVLGYIPRDNRVYLADKDANVYSYNLSLAVVEYQTAILRGDLEAAESLLPEISQDQRNRVARFLESQELKELALEISTDNEHKFDLALQLNKLEYALEIAKESGSESKWRTLSDVALSKWQFNLAEECLKKANDLSGLLLMYTAYGNSEGLRELAQQAADSGKNNIAFSCYWTLGDLENCLDILIRTDRIPEAAFFARSYIPSQISRVVKLWKESLISANKTTIAESLADPEEYEELFDNYKDTLIAEEAMKNKMVYPSTAYPAPGGGLDLKGNGLEHTEFYNLKNANGATHEDEQSLVPDDERILDETMSHMSLEVNTTGTGSIRGDIEFDDSSSQTTQEPEPVLNAKSDKE
ncbi:Coatomer, beta' subunit [Basidiobolus meristosporus CBS 931.73]|uniref:Coatomer subunit beta' n=1 Tax=Basidiobolus meristosporus CBS 931.73 TaxID=1314790 RepID=A0A1Y1X3A2_9FUNG|nr:Coatomer, beta' subunit [Basidiobolus meristosporus CBS 931.73]|eukprot:ORX80290.1 Coatomer, beta' subunit [Basidiobolus meristosporus CBS 931.73]